MEPDVRDDAGPVAERTKSFYERMEDDFTQDGQSSSISHLDEEDLLDDARKPGLKRRTIVCIALGAIGLVIVLFSCLAIAAGSESSSRPMLLVLEGESELALLSEALSCPPGACALLDSAAFAGVPASLWLVSMDPSRSPAQVSYDNASMHLYCPELIALALLE